MFARIAVCFLFVFLPLHSLDEWFYDQYFKIRGFKQIPTELILAPVNDVKLLRFQGKENPGSPGVQQSWDLRTRSSVWYHDFYGALLKRITAQKPKLIVFTTFFDQVDDPKRASLNFPNVVFSAILNEENKLIPPPSHLTLGESYGYTNIFPDPDNMVRRAHLVYSSGASLALRTYRHLYREPIRRDLLEPLWIDYRGPAGSYKTHGVNDILDGGTNDIFHGKIVLIGRDGSRSTDFMTPLGRMSALEIQANIIDTFLGNREIRHLSNWVKYSTGSVIVIISVGLLLAFPLKSAWILLLIFYGLLSFITLFAFSHFKVWLGAANPLFCIFGTHLILLGFKLGLQEERQWRTQKEAEYLHEMDQFKNNFISLFSHDLKTPIAKVKAITERVLKEFHNLPAEVKNSLKSIDRTNDELARIISDILKVTKMESMALEPNKEVVDLNRLVEEAAARLKFQAEEKDIRLILDLEPLFSIEGDQQLLREVITNLVENAIKYSPPNRHVIVRTREENNKITVWVLDEGIGIAPEELPRVTGKFYRGKEASRTTKGTGLGLYLAKYFVELHQGNLEIKSRFGQGTEVSFTLPISV